MIRLLRKLSGDTLLDSRIRLISGLRHLEEKKFRTRICGHRVSRLVQKCAKGYLGVRVSYYMKESESLAAATSTLEVESWLIACLVCFAGGLLAIVGSGD